MRIRKARYASAFLAVGALTLSAACSSGGADDEKKPAGDDKKASVQNFGIGSKADSTGPAVPVEGAKPGVRPTTWTRRDSTIWTRASSTSATCSRCNCSTTAR